MILKVSKNIKNCRLCNTNKLLTVYDLGSTPIGDDYTKK